MKKLFNQAPVLLTVAIILGLTGCLTDNPYDPRNEGDVVTISLQIAPPATSGTRAISGTITPGTVLPFLSGDLYLATPTGVIVEHFTISSAPNNFNTGGRNINLAALTGGTVTIPNVSPGVRGGQVIIVGNTSNNATAGTVSSIGNRVIDVLHQGQNSLNLPGPGVNLFGSAPLIYFTTVGGVRTYHPQGIDGTLNGRIRINPTIARLEIPNIMGMGYIQSFSVEGVFIDRFYRNAHINGSVVATSLVDNVDAGNTFAWNTAGFPSAFHGITFDTGTWNSVGTPNAGGLGFNLPVASPGGANVWSYHLFAQTTDTTAPRIVFRLNNITLRANAPVTLNHLTTGSHFVTFNTFVFGGSHTGIRAGYIYSIPPHRLAFSHEHLQDAPVPMGGATLSTRAVPLEVEELIIAN